MALTFNEELACEAVLRRIEGREGMTCSRMWSPEKERDPDPVELVCSIGDRLYALEHTGIEPFEGHVRLNAEADLRIDPIIRAVSERTPNDVLELHLPVMALQNVKIAQLRKVQEAIVTWILTTAPQPQRMPYASYHRGSGVVAPAGAQFSVELFQFEPIMPPGRLQIKYLVGGNRAQARKERIARACERKFPKLAVGSGARTRGRFLCSRTTIFS